MENQPASNGHGQARGSIERGHHHCVVVRDVFYKQNNDLI